MSGLRKYTDDELAAMTTRQRELAEAATATAEGLTPRQRAFAQVQAMTDEERVAFREQLDADAEHERRKERAHARWAAYVQHRPASFANAHYASLEPHQNPEKRVTGWWVSGHKNLLLTGPIRTGKTYAGFSICNEVAALARDQSIGPVSVTALRAVDFRDLVAPAGVNGRDVAYQRGREARLREIERADLLLLDDLTAAQPTDWLVEQLYAVIDARTTNPSARTIVTMNVSDAKEVNKALGHYGSPIAGRLMEDTVPVMIAGPKHSSWAKWDGGEE